MWFTGPKYFVVVFLRPLTCIIDERSGASTNYKTRSLSNRPLTPLMEDLGQFYLEFHVHRCALPFLLTDAGQQSTANVGVMVAGNWKYSTRDFSLTTSCTKWLVFPGIIECVLVSRIFSSHHINSVFLFLTLLIICEALFLFMVIAILFLSYSPAISELQHREKSISPSEFSSLRLHHTMWQ